MVTWEPPLTPNGIIQSYRIEYNRTTDGIIDSITTSDTSVIITMLEKFTTYQVQVFATTVAEGEGSDIVIVTTDEDSELVLHIYVAMCNSNYTVSHCGE